MTPLKVRIGRASVIVDGLCFEIFTGPRPIRPGIHLDFEGVR